MCMAALWLCGCLHQSRLDEFLLPIIMSDKVQKPPWSSLTRCMACLLVQYKYRKPEEECKFGAHLNFETLGNLSSAIWHENPPFPQQEGLVVCDVTYGMFNFLLASAAKWFITFNRCAHFSGQKSSCIRHWPWLWLLLHVVLPVASSQNHSSPGQVSNITSLSAPAYQSPCAGALNFRDVMLAYGKLSKQQMAHESGGNNIGFEFAGTQVQQATSSACMAPCMAGCSITLLLQEQLVRHPNDCMSHLAAIPLSLPSRNSKG